MGDEVATYMLAGDLIILGNAGKNLGNYLIQGNIYIRGDFGPLGHNTLLVEITGSDIEKLQQHFDSYQISAAPESFRKIIRLSEKPFYKTKEPSENQVEIESITK